MLKVGLIGCGHISETYFRSQTYFNNINIVACADINIDAAKKCAQEYNIQEKQPFTDSPREEFASSGTYYFKNKEILEKCLNKLFA